MTDHTENDARIAAMSLDELSEAVAVEMGWWQPERPKSPYGEYWPWVHYDRGERLTPPPYATDHNPAAEVEQVLVDAGIEVSSFTSKWAPHNGHVGGIFLFRENDTIAQQNLRPQASYDELSQRPSAIASLFIKALARGWVGGEG